MRKMAARIGISKTNVIDTAFGILEETQSIQLVSMTAVAKRLGIRVQSLYAHIDGSTGLKRELALRSLEKLAQDIPELIVYPINMEPPNKLKVRDFLRELGVVSLNTYFDPKLELVKKFKLIGMPTTVLLDKDGNEFGRIMGEFDFSDKKFINFLMKNYL